VRHLADGTYDVDLVNKSPITKLNDKSILKSRYVANRKSAIYADGIRMLLLVAGLCTVVTVKPKLNFLRRGLKQLIVKPLPGMENLTAWVARSTGVTHLLQE
jgi:hypothetical protein